MTVSPIGLHADIATHAASDRPVTPGIASEPSRPAVPDRAPAVRTVSVDLPEPMPGRLKLDLDRETGRVVGRIVDKESGRLIRQIPSEEALKLAASVKRMFEPLFTVQA